VEVLGGSVVGFVMEFRPKVVVAVMFDVGTGTLFGNGREEMCGLFRCWGRWCTGNVRSFGEEMLESL
jgi:hypothetical protein